jgi:glycosyltransferase involved in cell wall biosynthesis
LNWLPDALRADFNVRLALDIEDSKFDSALVEKLRDKGLEVLKSGNFGGPGLARNELLANFKSDYVVFWDADDFPHVETIRKFLNHYTGDKKKFIVGQWELRQVGKKTSRSSDSNLSSVAFQPGLWRILCPSVVISGELFPATRMGEDQVYLFNIGFFREQPVW